MLKTLTSFAALLMLESGMVHRIMIRPRRISRFEIQGKARWSPEHVMQPRSDIERCFGCSVFIYRQLVVPRNEVEVVREAVRFEQREVAMMVRVNVNHGWARRS